MAVRRCTSFRCTNAFSRCGRRQHGPRLVVCSYLFSKNSKIWIISRDLDATDVGFDTILEEWKETKGIEAVFIPWKRVARVLQEKDGGQQFLLFTQVFKPEASSTKTETQPAAAKQPGLATEVTVASSPRTIRIFLASSSELREDRDAFDLYFRQQNDRAVKEGVLFEDRALGELSRCHV